MSCLKIEWNENYRMMRLINMAIYISACRCMYLCVGGCLCVYLCACVCVRVYVCARVCVCVGYYV